MRRPFETRENRVESLVSAEALSCRQALSIRAVGVGSDAKPQSAGKIHVEKGERPEGLETLSSGFG